MMMIANAEIKEPNPHEARMLLRNMYDGRMTNVNWKPIQRGFRSRTAFDYLCDHRESNKTASSVLTSDQFDFLVSIRPGLLPYRQGNNHYLVTYYPSRFARQFGFDQDVPSGDLECPSNPSIHQMLVAWGTILYKGSEVDFYMPSSERVGLTSENYAMWYYHGAGSYLSINISQLLPKVSNDMLGDEIGTSRKR